MSGISFGGLSSGLDTNTIIDQLMQIEARPKTLLESRRTTLGAASTAFASLRSLVSSMNLAALSIGNPADWSPITAESSDKTRVAVRSSGTGTAGSIQVSVTQLASNHTVASWGQSDLNTTTIATGTLNLSTSAGSTTVTVGGTGTLQNVVDAINSQSAIGLRATAVSVGGGQYKLQLSATNASETVTTDPLQFGPLGPAWGTVSNAQQAIVHIGDALSGYDITSNSNTITDIMPGVSVDLLAAGGGPITITSKSDTGKLADKVQAVVDAYNKVADEIKAKTKFDVAAKTKEPLYGEVSVRTSQRVLSDAVLGDVTTSPGAVGIQTTRDGKLTFDRAKFISALESDPAGTQNLMISTDPLAPGLITRLKTAVTTVNDVANGLLTSGQNAADAQIRTLNEQIARWEDRLVTRRETLRRQFTQMETALGQLQSFGSALSGGINQLNANRS